VLSGRPALPTDALRFAFAGSYFFILQMLIRRYFQDDLKTTAYINSTARIIVVALTVTTIGSAWPASWTAEQLNVLAFFIGVFPNVGLKALQTLLTVPLRPLIPSLERDYPLSDLDGLNVWYESRLLEEGIEDMQNLATANVVDVMLRTKVPVGRLVDWVDQAHLFLRVKGDGKEEPSDREKLRLLGIRCATDLEDAFTASPDASGEDLQVERERISRLRWVLNKGGIDDGAPSRTSVMLKTFEREPNLEYVRNWKTVSRPAAAGALPMTIRVEDLLPEDPEALDRVGAVAAAVEAAPRMEEPAPAPAPAS
jgi:hypothetical protein